jgi:hypothetical protein
MMGEVGAMEGEQPRLGAGTARGGCREIVENVADLPWGAPG